MTLVATCLFGLEHLLGEEIESLGYTRTDTIDGRVYFEGDCEAVALSNVFLRYAERILILLGSQTVTTFDELFEFTKSLPLENYIGREDAFPVRGHSIRSTLFSVPDCQKIIKRASAARLSSVYGDAWLKECGRTYQMEFFILKDKCDLMIDTTGVPLHKRGYRPEANAAPLRETLAAALAHMARPREDVLFVDPFCGSGTIAIEAAMQMNRIAPGARRSFAAEQFSFIGKKYFDDAREEAREGEIRSSFEVLASDIDPACVSLTERNARAAGVLHAMKIEQSDARRLQKNGRRGTIVTNPPYGERMGSLSEVETLYREIGRSFAALAPWQIYIISSHERFEMLYGRRADKVRKLYNGMIPCYYYQYFKNPDAFKKKGRESK